MMFMTNNRIAEAMPRIFGATKDCVIAKVGPRYIPPKIEPGR